MPNSSGRGAARSRAAPRAAELGVARHPARRLPAPARRPARGGGPACSCRRSPSRGPGAALAPVELLSLAVAWRRRASPRSRGSRSRCCSGRHRPARGRLRSSGPQLTRHEARRRALLRELRAARACRRRARLASTGYAIVLGILALAMVCDAAGGGRSARRSTTVRYASFAALYIVVSSSSATPLQRRLAWALVSSAIAAVLDRELLQRSQEQASCLRDQNDLAFILATTLPLTFWLLGVSRGRGSLACRCSGSSSAGSCSASRAARSSGWPPA